MGDTQDKHSVRTKETESSIVLLKSTISEYHLLSIDMFTNTCRLIFNESINAFHRGSSHYNNPYQEGTIENRLYLKNWIDCGQWALESHIRFDPCISAEKAFEVKQRIDKSNQKRTDVVEEIDDFFLEEFKNVKTREGASVNTESPGWAIDRLSIQALKIHHVKTKTENTATDDEEARAKSLRNLAMLKEQQEDMEKALEDLFDDYKEGRKKMKVFKAMKMYNDPNLNPVLYSATKRCQVVQM